MFPPRNPGPVEEQDGPAKTFRVVVVPGHVKCPVDVVGPRDRVQAVAPEPEEASPDRQDAVGVLLLLLL